MPMRPNSMTYLLLAGLMTIILAGCSREDPQVIRVQRVPKEPLPVQDQDQLTSPIVASAQGAQPTGGAGGMQGMQGMGSAPPEAAGEIQWTTPTGWKQLPGSGMRVASLQVSPQNPDVQLSVIPLVPSPLLANVNRWEGQIGLPSSKEADLGKVVTHLDVAGTPADLVDLTGPASANPRQRLLGAMISHGDRMWFFKLQGPVDVVGGQKQNFETFIKSVRFAAGGAAQPQAPAPGAGAPQPTQLPAGHPALPGGDQQQPQLPAGHPQLPPDGMGNMPPMGAPGQGPAITCVAPDGWMKDPPMTLRVISFKIGDGDKQASMVVSALPAVGSGSRIDNINRWRGQVGLAPIKETDPQASQPVTVGGVQGALFDLVGPGDRQRAMHMLVAWVPKGDNWWFFKLTGPDQTVTEQQNNFNSFLKSVQFVGEKP